MLLQGILALSYDIPGGLGGELHLGHGAFFGIGAYVSALSFINGFPWWLSLACAGLSGGLAARLLQPMLVSLKGVSFALVSLGFLLICGLLARNLEPISGGTAGISFSASMGMAGPYRWTLALFVVTLWIHETVADSRFGRALVGASNDFEAAMSCGVPVESIRGKALVMGSVMAALAGGIYPFPMAYISPQSAFGLEVALAPVVMVLVGGPGTRWGPLLGVVVYTGLQEWLWTRGWEGALTLMGASLMAAGIFLPKGIAGALKGIKVDTFRFSKNFLRTGQ
jgi:branched-chain amino acid transport system permease protein